METAELAQEIVIPGERRKTMRRTVNDAALTMVDGSDAATSCQVLNISDGGARIELKTACVLPRRFKLWISGKQLMAECEQVWRNKNLVGLKFRSTAYVS